MHTNTMWGIGLGVAAGLATAAIATDHGFDSGTSTGIAIPATFTLGAVGATVLAPTSRAGWRFSGIPALAGVAEIVRGPLTAIAIGSSVGLGVATLLDSIWPAGNGEPSTERAREIAEQARQLDREVDERVAADQRTTAEAQERFDRAAGELDDALGGAEGRMGTDGTVGEGRIDVTGMSPEAAAAAVMDAYSPRERLLRTDSIRVDGVNVFAASKLAGANTMDEEMLTAFFRDQVDVADPPGVIDAIEARTWQAGDRGEVRTTGVEGAPDSGDGSGDGGAAIGDPTADGAGEES